MNYNRISQDIPTKITNKNMAYESIMGLLFPNIRSHKSCNVNAYYKDRSIGIKIFSCSSIFLLKWFLL